MGKRKNKTYSEIKGWKLYVILFPDSSDFFVGMTSQEDLRDTYKNHYILRNKFTRQHFEDAKERELAPDIYLLEVFESAKNMAFSRIVAWAKLLIDYGYTCINGDTFVSYTEDLLEQTQAFLAELEDADIEKLLSDENSLFPNYKTREKKNGNSVITISVTPEEYEIIKQRAKEADIWSISGYCRCMAVHGKIYALTNPVPWEYINALQEGINTMQQSILTIHKLKQYFPSDLAKIQEFVDAVKDYYGFVLQEGTKINNQIVKHNR